VDAQGQIEEKLRTQVLLPRDKIDPEIIYNLQLVIILYKVGLLDPEFGPENQAYTEDFPEENTPIRGVIPLEEGILLEALPVDSAIIAPIEVLLEAPAEYSSL
jgi:hypothetical protein